MFRDLSKGIQRAKTKLQPTVHTEFHLYQTSMVLTQQPITLSPDSQTEPLPRFLLLYPCLSQIIRVFPCVNNIWPLLPVFMFILFQFVLSAWLNSHYKMSAGAFYFLTQTFWWFPTVNRSTIQTAVYDLQGSGPCHLYGLTLFLPYHISHWLDDISLL